MKAEFRTLSISNKVGDSVTGTCNWGPRFERVSIGRSIPSLKKVEDAEAILRCGFFDFGAPIELNLVQSESLRSFLQQRVLFDSHTSGWLDPESLLRVHPSVGYLPPELFSVPNTAGLRALAASSVTSEEVVRRRLIDPPVRDGQLDWSKITSKHIGPDGLFWHEIAKSGLYPRLMGDLLARGGNLRLSLLAPPVPVLHEDWTRSADLQFELNAAASVLMKPPMGDTPTIRPLYSVYAHPSSLGHPQLLQQAIDQLRLALAETEYGFMGVYLAFIDIETIGREGAVAVRSAKDFTSKVIRIATERGRFAIVSDVGPIGPSFLDQGAAFTTYGLGMSMHRTYPIMRPPKKTTRPAKKRVRESKYGRVLGGPWNYILLRYRDVRNQNWKLEDPVGKFVNEVPRSLRGAPYDQYRVNFSKPYNAAVQEVLNDARERELNSNKNARPGKSVLGRSDDPTIAPWA